VIIYHQGNHWDDVILNYKEIELAGKNQSDVCRNILSGVEEFIRVATNTRNT
jgi:hypothetical protein